MADGGGLAGSSNWILELEEALLDELPPEQIKVLLAGRSLPASLRTDVWSHCLDINGKKSKLEKFDDVFDHPDQAQIRQASQKFEDIQDMSDVESILTAYLKYTGKIFGAEYIHILTPITRLALSRNEKYCIFESILDRFVPQRTKVGDGGLYHIARLLLLYHDPHLCNHLDSLKINFVDFSSSWFSCLLAGDLTAETSQLLWDSYIVNSDPWLIFFMVITMLVNCRDHILEINNDRAELLARLARLPGQIEAEDIPDLVTLAQVMSARTPSSFKAKYFETVFTCPEPELETEIKSRLCLPVSPQEVVSSELVNSQFFVVDCRSADQYNASHLSSAFHLDCSLMLQDPAQFSTACSALLAFHQTSVGAGQGEHLVFLGDGQRGEVEDNMNMAVSRFLQQHTKFISILEGGYPSLHSGGIQSDSKCLVKTESTAVGGGGGSSSGETSSLQSPEPGSGRLDQIKVNLKSKSEVLKSSLLNYIYSPQSSSSEKKPAPRKKSTGYKGTGDVFSLEDDEEEEGTRYLDEIKGANTTVHMAECQRITETGSLTPCHLLITSTHLTTLVPVPSQQDKVTPSASHHLSTIVKITSKKKQPEVITFKYGTSNRDEVTVFDMDRYYIPTAGKVTMLVKQQIEKLKNS
eukprot:TRINITY_DN5156_c0_g1_i6.p1 TRINITY_DN5156_c0_g1~~TRINITY_DN5156_c0_g1_i6.p1  ORF type:complete len:637 (+),score=133.37 TRINITY_DN5156_c0_g1_i6:49-1959(+)